MDSKQIKKHLDSLKASTEKEVVVDKKVVLDVLDIIITERRRATAASRRKLAKSGKAARSGTHRKKVNKENVRAKK